MRAFRGLCWLSSPALFLRTVLRSVWGFSEPTLWLVGILTCVPLNDWKEQGSEDGYASSPGAGTLCAGAHCAQSLVRHTQLCHRHSLRMAQWGCVGSSNNGELITANVMPLEGYLSPGYREALAFSGTLKESCMPGPGPLAAGHCEPGP